VNLIFGAVIDENMGDEVRITVIATGFEQSRVATRRPVSNRERSSTGGSVPVARQAPRPAAKPEAANLEEQPDSGTPSPPPAPPEQPRNTDEEFTSRVYDTNDLDIPAFLRRR
jgi:cell division protein FtsZ